MNDHYSPAIYYLNNHPDDNFVMILIKNSSGKFYQIVGFTLSYSALLDQDMQKIQWHPKAMEAWITFHTGVSYNYIVDASGTLVSSGVAIVVHSKFLATGSYNAWGYLHSTDGFKLGYRQVNYSDVANGKGPCGLNIKDKRTRLHWKNALGGYDFFNFYGTVEKSVKIKGSRYKRFNEYTAFRGFRGEKELWKKRTDEWKVLSQPLNETTAVWLEELASSPEVWMEVKGTDAARNNENHLIPVLITPGGYSTFNTEDRMHFVEIKFTLSNERTQQRG